MRPTRGSDRSPWPTRPWPLLVLSLTACQAHLPPPDEKIRPPTEEIRPPADDPLPPPPPAPVCGDGRLEGAEQCEPGRPLAQTCQALGFAGGALACRDCRLDTSGCVAIPPERKPPPIFPPPPPFHGRRGSCPYIYLWDGGRYHYHTDLSGSVLAAGMRFLRPEFYGPNIYALEGFEPRDGVYRLKAREVIAEASFFDAAALLLVDVPADRQAYTRWSFTSQLLRAPERGFLTARTPRPPRAARSEDGADVLAEISLADGVPLPVRPDGLSRVEVDFGPLAHPERARLIITSWGHYADLRRHQRPPFSAGTTIETPDEHGHWTVRRVAGKSAGDARTWAIDLAGALPSGEGRMRITLAHLPSVLDVLDALWIDDAPPAEIRVQRLLPRRATLGFGGAATVRGSTLRRRIRAADDHLPLDPLSILTGRTTRTGDVLPLLRGSDDRFVVMAHGDELLLEFDASPPPPDGWARFVFLEADVFYTLKFHPFGQVTETIEPLPFHGMTEYPYDLASWPYRDDPGYREYLDAWNTRLIRPAEP